MTNRPDKFMPLYIGEFLADTLHLDDAQIGAYILLIMHYWRTSKPLPDDDNALRTISRSTPERWKKSKATLMAFFQKDEAGWRHKRIDKELGVAVTKYEARKSAADAMHARRKKQKGCNADAMHDGPHDALHMQPQPQPQDFPNFVGESRSGVERGARAPKKGASPRPTTSNWEQSMPNWAAFREKIGEAHWVNWFDQCRTNGSETTILAPTEFQADQLKFRYLTALKDHFGPSVYIKFDPEKWNPKAGAKP